MVLGLGSGSTVFYLIEALGKKVKEGLTCLAVPTSGQTRLLAAKNNIPLADLNDIPTIDLTIDGADEIDAELQLIKGGGGFLLQEKMVAAASKELVIIADHGKLKPKLGNFPLPVEVIPYGWKQVKRHIQEQLQIDTVLRVKQGKPFVTDHGHYILDLDCKAIKDVKAMNLTLLQIPGIVETGLFINMCNKALIADADGQITTLTK